MPRALAYYHLLQLFGLKPAEVDALDPQVVIDLLQIHHLRGEITPADG